MAKISSITYWPKIKYVAAYYLDSIIGSINKNLVWLRIEDSSINAILFFRNSDHILAGIHPGLFPTLKVQIYKRRVCIFQYINISVNFLNIEKIIISDRLVKFFY